MANYPTISISALNNLKIVLDNARHDPTYLDGRKAPYDKPTRELLKSLIADPILEVTVPESKPEGQQKRGAKSKKTQITISELDKEYDELRGYIQDIKRDINGLEPNEKIQVIKTHAALIEKMLGMKERIKNLKKMDQFIATVIQLMEDELPQDLRMKVLEKLEPFADEED